MTSGSHAPGTPFEAMQPGFLVGTDLRTGRLVELMPAYRSLELGIHAVYATRKHLPMKARRLIDFLVEAFESGDG